MVKPYPKLAQNYSKARVSCNTLIRPELFTERVTLQAQPEQPLQEVEQVIEQEVEEIRQNTVPDRQEVAVEQQVEAGKQEAETAVDQSSTTAEDRADSSVIVANPQTPNPTGSGPQTTGPATPPKSAQPCIKRNSFFILAPNPAGRNLPLFLSLLCLRAHHFEALTKVPASKQQRSILDLGWRLYSLNAVINQAFSTHLQALS